MSGNTAILPVWDWFICISTKHTNLKKVCSSHFLDRNLCKCKTNKPILWWIYQDAWKNVNVKPYLINSFSPILFWYRLTLRLWLFWNNMFSCRVLEKNVSRTCVCTFKCYKNIKLTVTEPPHPQPPDPQQGQINFLSVAPVPLSSHLKVFYNVSSKDSIKEKTPMISWSHLSKHLFMKARKNPRLKGRDLWQNQAQGEEREDRKEGQRKAMNKKQKVQESRHK